MKISVNNHKDTQKQLAKNFKIWIILMYSLVFKVQLGV